MRGSTEVNQIVKSVADKLNLSIYGDIRYNKETHIYRASVRTLDGTYVGSIEVVLGSNGRPISTGVQLSSYP